LFENRFYRRIFRPKGDGVSVEWRKLHNEKPTDLSSSPNINQIIKSRKMRWAGHVARILESKSAYRILVRKPEEMRALRRPRHRWEGNIKIDLEEARCGP
jgi:hypothetical protein